MGNAMVDRTPVDVAQAVAGDELDQYLTFHLGEELFAIGILDVKEIIEVGTISRVPLTPAFIRGVINLRGRVIPALDLAARLERGRVELTKRSCIVVVEVGSGEEPQTLGMLVDEVNEVLEIGPENIQPAPEFGADIRTDFIDRMGKIDERVIVILDVDNVLSVEELASLSELGARAGRAGA